MNRDTLYTQEVPKYTKIVKGTIAGLIGKSEMAKWVSICLIY